MRFDIPDFTLLADVAIGEVSLKGRLVIFHYPTHTILELVQSDDPIIKAISPKYEWERINRYGDIDRFTFIVHRYVTDNIDDVFEKAKEWYQSVMDWMDTNDDALDAFLREWDNRSDDLPN
jgi:hypothetical protein